MSYEDVKFPRRKRKQVIDEAAETGPFSHAVSLEMLSDEEGESVGSGSDHEEVDEFPEIDTGSDSEDEGDSSLEDSGKEDEDEAEDSGDESDLQIFPKAKDIISDITGKPKRVYPEIEPNYDSDSSTEDVCKVPCLSFYDMLKSSPALGSKPCR